MNTRIKIEKVKYLTLKDLDAIWDWDRDKSTVKLDKLNLNIMYNKINELAMKLNEIIIELNESRVHIER